METSITTINRPQMTFHVLATLPNSSYRNFGGFEVLAPHDPPTSFAYSQHSEAIMYNACGLL